MDYSDKIQTHIDALRHYLLAQAEANDPFISPRDRNERISRDILMASSMVRGMYIDDIPGMTPALQHSFQDSLLYSRLTGIRSSWMRFLCCPILLGLSRL